MSSSCTQVYSKNRSLDQEKMDSLDCGAKSNFLKALEILFKTLVCSTWSPFQIYQIPMQLAIGPPKKFTAKRVVELLKKEKQKLTTVYFHGKFFLCTTITCLPQVKYPFPLPMLTQFIQRFMHASPLR